MNTHYKCLYGVKNFIFCLLFLWGCQDDGFQEITLIEEESIQPEILVDAAITGIVNDPEGKPLSNAFIRSGNSTYTTDNDGLFWFNTQAFDYNGTGIKVEHPDYLPFFTKLYPALNQTHFVQFNLGDSYFSSSAQGGTERFLQLDNNAELHLSAQSVNKANGQAYSGPVECRSASINPYNENVAETYGGDFIGINNLAETVFLKVIGAGVFHLSTPSGENLSLNSEAKTTLHVPALSNISELPEEAILWTLAPSGNYWVESGTAQLNGNVYAADITESGHYCIARSGETIYTEGITLLNGIPYSGVPVKITNSGGQMLSQTFSNAEGYFRLPTPEMEAITLTIGVCSYESIYNGSFVSGNEDYSLGTIELKEQAAETIEIKGQLMNCNGEALEEGFLLTLSGKESVFLPVVSSSGEFNLQLPSCGETSLSLTVLDQGTQVSTYPLNLTAASSINTGPLLICENLPEEYIWMKVEGNIAIYPTPTASLNGSSNTQVNFEDGQGNQFSLRFQGQEAGPYTDEMINLVWNAPTLGENGYSFYCPNSTDGCGFTTFEIFEYGENEDQWIRGAFKATLWMQTINPPVAGYKEVEGIFQLKR